MSEDALPARPETDPRWNREPGIVIVPGSAYANEMAKFEGRETKWTIGTVPGNPYTYKPFPKMVYRAERWNGAPACMAAPPDMIEFKDPREFDRFEQLAQRFNERCQLIVNDEREFQKAMEAGYRESPGEAVAFLISRDQKISQAEAHRNYEDRNMSDAAKAEIKAAKEAIGNDPLPEVVEQPRRGRPRKND
jgi:hypothetical protein